MLVLSRRENQKVLFPNLGITVEIVGLQGSSVKLGIDAPPEIRILRSELAEENKDEIEKVRDGAPASVIERHHRNNQLNSVALQIQIAQKLLKRGDQEQAMLALQGSLSKLQLLEGEVGQAGQTNVPSAQKPIATRKALLVEDDANERQLMATILTMCGFEVDIVEDGLAAIDYLKTHERPDCVLMDMEMPRLSGSEAIAKIREDLEIADLPIYGVSGLQRHEANVPLGDRGVSGWFAKPVDATKLVRQIFDDVEGLESRIEPSLN